MTRAKHSEFCLDLSYFRQDHINQNTSPEVDSNENLESKYHVRHWRIMRLVWPLFGLLIGCGAGSQHDQVFSIDEDLNSTIVIRRDEMVITNDQKRMDVRVSPASTFKIAHSLFALEDKIVGDKDEVIHWDGKMRWLDDWNQDLTLQSAFKYSAIWFYQALARQRDAEFYKQWLAKYSYGNQQVGSDHESFWIDDSLKISPREQADWLMRLAHNKLPISKSTRDQLFSIMKTDVEDQCDIYGKTGWNFPRTKREIGWYVGLEKCPNRPWRSFAVLIRGPLPKNVMLPMRKQLALKALRQTR